MKLCTRSMDSPQILASLTSIVSSFSFIFCFNQWTSLPSHLVSSMKLRLTALKQVLIARWASINKIGLHSVLEDTLTGFVQQGITTTSTTKKYLSEKLYPYLNKTLNANYSITTWQNFKLYSDRAKLALYSLIISIEEYLRNRSSKFY